MEPTAVNWSGLFGLQNLNSLMFVWWFVFCVATAPNGPGSPNFGATAPSGLGFLDHAQRRSTVGRTPLYVWSARRRDFYLTTHNTHSVQTSMPPAGLEPTISASDMPQTYPLGGAVTGTFSWWTTNCMIPAFSKIYLIVFACNITFNSKLSQYKSASRPQTSTAQLLQFTISLEHLPFPYKSDCSLQVCLTLKSLN